MSELTNNTEALEKLGRQLKKQNSLLQSFLRGLITGLGATVGLSIFLGGLIVLLNYFAQLVGIQSNLGPWLQNLDARK